MGAALDRAERRTGEHEAALMQLHYLKKHMPVWAFCLYE
jgi:hypothetical protein